MKAHLMKLSSSFLINIICVLLNPIATPFILVSVQAKTVSNSFQLSGAKSEHTATKFALSHNAVGRLQIFFRSDKEYPFTSSRDTLKVYFYSSEHDWRKVSRAPTCEEKTKYARKSKSVNSWKKNVRYDHRQQKEIYTWTANIDSPIGGNIHDDDADYGDLDSGMKPQFWYITVADCSLELAYRDDLVPKIEYALEIMDEPTRGTYSHLSYDEQGIGFLHMCNVILCIGISGYLFSKVYLRCRKNQELHISIFLIICACAINAFSSLFQVIHLHRYERNGTGSYFSDALSAHAEAVVDSLICWIMLAVSVGWTLPMELSSTQNNNTSLMTNMLQKLRKGFAISSSHNNKSLIRNTGVQIFGILELIHGILCQWGRTYNDDFDCYHDLEHLPGRILLFFRIFLSLLFLCATAIMKRQCHTPSLSKFLHFFSLIGASWFISLPSLAVAVSSNPIIRIPFHRRHHIMTVLGMGLQITSLISLGWLFSGAEDSSAYHKVSTVNDGGIGGSLTGIGGGDGPGGNVSVFKFGKSKIRLD